MANITPNRPFFYSNTTSTPDELPKHVAAPACSQLIRYASGQPRAMVVGRVLDDLAIFKAAYGESRAVQGGESHFRAWLRQQKVRPGDVVALPSGIDGFVGKVHDTALLEALRPPPGTTGVCLRRPR